MLAYHVHHFKSNPLLLRKQFSLTVLHPNRANVPKSEMKEYLTKKFKVADPKSIILYGFLTAFGGGRSTGMVLIYDDVLAATKFEKKYRLVRSGVIAAGDKRPSRRSRKETKNRKKKVRGVAKTKVGQTKKK